MNLGLINWSCCIMLPFILGHWDAKSSRLNEKETLILKAKRRRIVGAQERGTNHTCVQTSLLDRHAGHFYALAWARNQILIHFISFSMCSSTHWLAALYREVAKAAVYSCGDEDPRQGRSQSLYSAHPSLEILCCPCMPHRFLLPLLVCLILAALYPKAQKL